MVPQLPDGEGPASVESEGPEEAMERLAHLEQLVVQLKEFIRDKDTQLFNKDAQLKVCVGLCLCLCVCVCSPKSQLNYYFFASYPQNEKDEADARFIKLKMQAKAKMVTLNKQITDLRGQGEAPVSLPSATTIPCRRR